MRPGGVRYMMIASPESVPGKENMENQITCPNCKRIISNNPIIEDAAKRQGSDSQSFNCECGERITYWQIAEQLRKQKNLGAKVQNWFHKPARA
jgi:hypothetical protein